MPLAAEGDVWMEEAAGEGILGAVGEGAAEEATTEEEPPFSGDRGGSCVRARFFASCSSSEAREPSS